jgi:hypothetical protein
MGRAPDVVVLGVGIEQVCDFTSTLSMVEELSDVVVIHLAHKPLTEDDMLVLFQVRYTADSYEAEI